MGIITKHVFSVVDINNIVWSRLSIVYIIYIYTIEYFTRTEKVHPVLASIVVNYDELLLWQLKFVLQVKIFNVNELI